MDFQEGVIIPIDKPYRMSSFGALAHVRFLISRKLGVRRVKTGHAGTLDPLATGVLLICTGRSTKLIEQLQAETKEYVATLRYGATTPSYDREHTVNLTYPSVHVTRQLVEQTLPQFVGDIMQVPPEYSACKIDGKRAYHLMRKGKEVTLKAKPLRIDEIQLLDFNAMDKTFTIRVVCSKGTYIRSLARDIGQALGSGAFLSSLRRTRVGKYRVDDCVSFDHFQEWLDKVEINNNNSK